MSLLTKGKTNWKYILIILIFAVIVGEGIFVYLRYFNKEILSFTKFPEIKKPEKIVEEVDKRILLDQARYEKIPYYTEEFGEKFNTDPPNTTVSYFNIDKGISFQIPYNPKWGTEKYKIPPYYEYENKVLFGPMFIFEAGSLPRACSMEFLPRRSAEEVIVSLEKFVVEERAYKVMEGIPRETIIKDTINGLPVVKYMQYDTLLGATPYIEVIGKKYNYKFSCFWIPEISKMEFIEDIIKTIQLIE
jgi:hypothetical protein